MLSGEGRIFDGRRWACSPSTCPWGDSLNIELGFDDLVRATSQLKRGERGPKSSGKRVLNQERVVRVFNDGMQPGEVVEAIPTGEG